MESFMNRIYLDIRMYSYGKFYEPEYVWIFVCIVMESFMNRICLDIRMYSYGKFYEQNMFGYSYV